MARNGQNEAFLRTSFLSAANAPYIEDMQAEYERNPGSVSDEWRHFFESLHEARDKTAGDGRGPSWGREIETENGELVAALTGDFTDRQREAGKLLTGIVVEIARNAAAIRLLYVDHQSRELPDARQAAAKCRLIGAQDALDQLAPDTLHEEDDDQNGLQDDQQSRTDEVGAPDRRGVAARGHLERDAGASGHVRQRDCPAV